MTLLNFMVKGEMLDDQTATATFCGNSLTLGELRNLFPFEGEFHFRLKVPARSLSMSGTYVWLDICGDDSQELDTTGTELDIMALAVCIPEDKAQCVIADSSYTEYYELLTQDLAENGAAPKERALRREGGTAHTQPRSTRKKGDSVSVPKNLSVNDMTKAASSIWSSVLSTASTLHDHVLSKAGQVSDASKRVLDFLNLELNTPFDHCDLRHMHRLQDLWDSVFDNEPFERETVKWKDLGFQKPDPIVDLKNSGTLPLLGMLYFCQQYAAQARSIISAQKSNTKSNYPFAIVCINISLLLADILGLKDKR